MCQATQRIDPGWAVQAVESGASGVAAGAILALPYGEQTALLAQLRAEREARHGPPPAMPRWVLPETPQPRITRAAGATAVAAAATAVAAVRDPALPDFVQLTEEPPREEGVGQRPRRLTDFRPPTIPTDTSTCVVCMCTPQDAEEGLGPLEHVGCGCTAFYHVACWHQSAAQARLRWRATHGMGSVWPPTCFACRGDAPRAPKRAPPRERPKPLWCKKRSRL